MACFIVPAAEAVITSAVEKIVEHHEKRVDEKSFVCISGKISRLNKMLWGGSALLAFEHLWHGEITPFFPFLTAARDPAAAAVMLHEMATSGTAMALLVTCVWLGIEIIGAAVQKRGKKMGGTEE